MAMNVTLAAANATVAVTERIPPTFRQQVFQLPMNILPGIGNFFTHFLPGLIAALIAAPVSIFHMLAEAPAALAAAAAAVAAALPDVALGIACLILGFADFAAWILTWFLLLYALHSATGLVDVRDAESRSGLAALSMVPALVCLLLQAVCLLLQAAKARSANGSADPGGDPAFLDIAACFVSSFIATVMGVCLVIAVAGMLVVALLLLRAATRRGRALFRYCFAPAPSKQINAAESEVHKGKDLELGAVEEGNEQGQEKRPA